MIRAYFLGVILFFTSNPKKLTRILLFVFMLSHIACTEDIDVKVDSGETRLSVEGAVTSDLKKHVVKLSKSSDVFDNQKAKAVTNAAVVVNDGSNDIEFIETEPGVYESEMEFAGLPGKIYSLSIKNVDINNDGTTEEYVASESMKVAYEVEKISLHFDPDYESRNGDDEDEGEFWLLSLFMQDDVKTKDFYGFACRVNDVLVHDTITEVIVQKDTYFNGEKTKGVDVGEFNQKKPDEILKENDKITLETYAISEDYYDFVSQLKEMDEGQSMFSGPPGNIKTNISNGAIGFFAVYSITRTSIVHTTEE